MSIKRRIQVTLEVYENKTVIHCGFISDTVLGVAHEEKAKDLVPFIIRELEMLQQQEQKRAECEKKCFRIAERFLSKKRGATLKVVK